MITVFFLSCDNRDAYDLPTNSSVNENLELSEYLRLKETTSYVTTNFQKMGVLKINVENLSNCKQYRFTTGKYFFLNKEKIDLASYSFILKNGMLSLKNDNSIKLSIYKNKPYIYSNKYVGFPTEDFYSNRTFNLLLLVMSEISTDINNKVESSFNTSKMKGGCSMLNTYYVYGTGGSLAVAETNLEAEIAYYTGQGGALSGCTAIRGANSGCFWEEYACIATQAYCCN